MVLFITDGAPNVISNTAGNGGVNVSGNDVALRSVEAAIYSANAIKSQGTRIVAVGVGAGITGAGPNLRAVSGPTLGTDFFQSASWDDLINQLKTVANGLTCRGTVQVNKTTVSNTDVTTPLAPGWTIHGGEYRWKGHHDGRSRADHLGVGHVGLVDLQVQQPHRHHHDQHRRNRPDELDSVLGHLWRKSRHTKLERQLQRQRHIGNECHLYRDQQAALFAVDLDGGD